MKLQRVKTREVEGKPYFKYALNPAPALIEELGWEPGDEIEAEVKNGKLVLTRRS